MLKKVLLIGLVLVLVLAIGIFFWARSVLGRDTVRTALASQISQAIGQPVTIGSISASIFPRVTVVLGEVTIGAPARISASTLRIGADVRALLSRRIEHGSMRLDGARIELPLPPLTLGASPGASSDGAPVEIVSIDEIVLNGVEIVSGGRTLQGDVEIEPRDKGVLVKTLTLRAEDTRLDASGEITDLAGPVGELAITAGQLNLDRLLAFAADFAGGSGLGAGESPAPGASAAGPPMNVVLALQAERATMGALALGDLNARARLTDGALSLEPLAFDVFAGRYDGGLRVGLGGATQTFHWNAKVSGIDVAAATEFAGRPDTMTGRLSGQVDLQGRGIDPGTAIRSARGTARLQVTDGVIRNLGLVRQVILATSMRADAAQQSAGSSDERFSRLGATLAVADGVARTGDLAMESENLRLTSAGSMRLDGSAVDLRGRVQLSDALSKQAGRDLVRYTQEEGRVTLPAIISGPADNLSVQIDMAAVAQRALRNKATEEAEKAIKKGLGDLFK
jgi:AsmA protein